MSKWVRLIQAGKLDGGWEIAHTARMKKEKIGGELLEIVKKRRRKKTIA